MGENSKSNTLYDEAERGEIDLLLKYEYDPRRFFATPILSERLAVAMPESMVTERLLPYALNREELIGKSYPEEKEFSDPTLFSDISFIKLGKHSATYERMSRILGDYSISPYVVENVSHTAMHYNMMREGLGAVMLSDVHVMTSNLFDERIRYFVPSSEQSKRNLYILEKRNAPKNPIAEAFIKTALEFCAYLEREAIPTEA